MPRRKQLTGRSWLQLDYSAGVLPVLKVDKDLDRLPRGFDINKLNGVAQGAYKLYDAEAMHGLPVGVQIIGRRLEEEKVLSIMGTVEEALRAQGNQYGIIDITSGGNQGDGDKLIG